LGAVDQMAQDPATVFTVGIHLRLAILALATGGNAGDQDPVTLLEVADATAHLLDDTHAFVAEDAPRCHRRHIALKNVQIGTADGGFSNFDNGVGRLAKLWFGNLLPVFLAR